MLSPEMQQDKAEMKLNIDDFSALEFRVFLRLLYTGRMDPGAWPVEPHDGCEAGGALETSAQALPLHAAAAGCGCNRRCAPAAAAAFARRWMHTASARARAMVLQ